MFTLFAKTKRNDINKIGNDDVQTKEKNRANVMMR